MRDLGAYASFTPIELDVDRDPALCEQYNDIVPAVAVADRVIPHAPIAEGALRSALAAALG